MTEQQALVKKAEEGCVESQYELGTKYFVAYGGFPLDRDKGFALLRKALEGGNVKAGENIIAGLLGPDYDAEGKMGHIAWETLNKLAQLKNPNGLLTLGSIYCGTESGFQSIVGKYPELGKYRSFEKGFPLIVSAIEIAESKDVNPFHPYFDYGKAAGAVATNTHRWLPSGGSHPKTTWEIENTELILKTELLLAEKHMLLTKNAIGNEDFFSKLGNPPTPYEKEQMKKEIIENVETLYDAAKGKVEAMLEEHSRMRGGDYKYQR